MQIVIDIPERIYKINQNRTLNIMDSELLEIAVKNGIPLPKGHERLIDADSYRKEMLDSRKFDFFKKLDMQPTIVEADNGEAESEE